MEYTDWLDHLDDWQHHHCPSSGVAKKAWIILWRPICNTHDFRYSGIWGVNVNSSWNRILYRAQWYVHQMGQHHRKSYRSLGRIEQQLYNLSQVTHDHYISLRRMMSNQQADLDAITEALSSGFAEVEQQITDLENQPAAAELDFSGLRAAVQTVTDAVPTPVPDPEPPVDPPVEPPA